MKKYPLFLILALALLATGCFFKRSPEHLVIEKPSYRYTNSGTVHDITALQKGGRILVVPFTAGAGVAADQELDRIALNIIKGLADAINENASDFQVITAEDAGRADFLIRGHVTEKGEPGKFRRMMMGKKISLGIQARILDAQSEKDLAVFSYQRQANRDQKSFENLGHEIGRDIGSFLIEKSQ